MVSGKLWERQKELWPRALQDGRAEFQHSEISAFQLPFVRLQQKWFLKKKIKKKKKSIAAKEICQLSVCRFFFLLHSRINPSSFEIQHAPETEIKVSAAPMFHSETSPTLFTAAVIYTGVCWNKWDFFLFFFLFPPPHCKDKDRQRGKPFAIWSINKNANSRKPFLRGDNGSVVVAAPLDSETDGLTKLHGLQFLIFQRCKKSFGIKTRFAAPPLASASSEKSTFSLAAATLPRARRRQMLPRPHVSPRPRGERRQGPSADRSNAPLMEEEKNNHLRTFKTNDKTGSRSAHAAC